MGLEKVICPECKGKDIIEKEGHNLLNLVFGIGTFTSIGVSTESYGLIVLGVAFYLLDFPFGSEREYYCNKCEYKWDAD